MAIVRDFPGYMKEFLRYYKHLGVDHVYMTGEDSFFRNGILENDEFVQKALMDSYVSFTFWHQWVNSASRGKFADACSPRLHLQVPGHL